MFDVVTTSIYPYTQYAGGPELEDRTLALKLFAGKHHTKAYPTPEELEDFGRRVCGVSQPNQTLQRITAAMHSTMERAKGDPRVPKALQKQMAQAWEWGYGYAG
jgi:serine/threonine-protein kinase HipA